jgi:N4-gp56 family major capsid protein
MASDFATNPTETGDYNDTIYSAIITDEVKDALMASVITPALLDFYDLAGQASKAVQIPKADKFTAAAVAEGTELTNTTLTSTSVTLTSSEVGIQATITDVLEVSDIPAAHGARLKQLGRAMGDKLDVDICALFGGFSTAVGSTGVNVALTDLLDAIFNLEVNDASDLGSIVGVFHPRQSADIRTELEADSASIYHPGGEAQPLRKAQNGFFGSWFGLDIFQTTNVPTANAAADRAGGIFVRDYALGMTQKWAAKLETMRWAPIRGFVLVATSMYGVGEVEDSAGVNVTTDA